MASVLLVQSLFFHDGGVLALGANFVNMAVLPAALTALLSRVSSQRQPRRRALLAGVGAWLGSVVGALSCAWQLAAAGVVLLRGGLAWMGSLHAGIGLLGGGAHGFGRVWALFCERARPSPRARASSDEARWFLRCCSP